MGRLRQPGQSRAKSKVVKPKATKLNAKKKSVSVSNGKKLNKAMADQKKRAREFHAVKRECLVR